MRFFLNPLVIVSSLFLGTIFFFAISLVQQSGTLNLFFVVPLEDWGVLLRGMITDGFVVDGFFGSFLRILGSLLFGCNATLLIATFKKRFFKTTPVITGTAAVVVGAVCVSCGAFLSYGLVAFGGGALLSILPFLQIGSYLAAIVLFGFGILNTLRH